MDPTITLAEYLFTRLKQLDVNSIHGVPGDYNLELLDFVKPTGLLWVGNTNELNAGYAADGYARIKGLGALVTTYGVGELSAINAIAGAFTERAAVVHIVGTPSRDSQDERRMVHHTLGDGEYRHFAQMYSHITAAQTNLLSPQTAPGQIDEILKVCLVQSRPVYIEFPADMVRVPVPGERLDSAVQVPQAVPDASFDKVASQIHVAMQQAKQPLILIDTDTRALRVMGEVEQLVKLTGWPTFTSASGKGLIDMTLPNVHGIYRGSYADTATKQYVDGADLTLCFGPHLSSTNTYGFSSITQAKTTISFTFTGIKIFEKLHRDVPAKHVLSYLLQGLEPTKLELHDKSLDLPHDRNLSFSEVSGGDMIRQDKLWRLLANFIRPGDIVLGETGTAGYGVREMAFPKHTRLFCPSTWLSIGYMLPACQGAALAQRELIQSSQYHGITEARTILFIGDGSFQMTCQELSTIIRLDLNVVVFLIDNDGYTIERCIHGLTEDYNTVGHWDYLMGPSFFGDKGAYTESVENYGGLEKVLSNERMTKGDTLRMIGIYLDRDDAPAGLLLDMMNREKIRLGMPEGLWALQPRRAEKDEGSKMDTE